MKTKKTLVCAQNTEVTLTIEKKCFLHAHPKTLRKQRLVDIGE